MKYVLFLVHGTVTSYPDSKFMFKVINNNTKLMKKCSKLTIKIPETYS